MTAAIQQIQKLRVGGGNDTYTFSGEYGTDIVSDSDCGGSGNTICHLKVGSGGTANDAHWRVAA
jgi:hypothetical protein